MTPLLEAAKGFTDIPIALLSLVFSLFSFKNNNKKWAMVFLFTGTSAILGSLAHIFVLPQIARKIIWTVLYLLMFEAVRRFTVLLLRIISKSFDFEKIIIIAEFSLYLVCLIFLYVVGGNDILVFVLFAVLCLFILISDLIYHKYKNKLVFLLFFFLCLSTVLQIPAEAFPILVVFEHISLFSALFIVYKISKK